MPEDGLLNFGGIVLGETCEKTFKVKNISNFDVKMKIATKLRGLQNKNYSAVFQYIPADVNEINRKEKKNILVISFSLSLSVK